MTARSVPEHGDMVIRKERREGKLVYLLHIAPGADQLVLPTRKDAVAHAVAFAKRQRVRVWLSDEGDDFVLLQDLRVVESR